MERVRANSVEIAWQELGFGEPAIVAVPQWFLSSRSMRLSPLIAELAGYHRVVLYDRRGTGESDKPGPPYSTARDAKDLAGLMDGVAVERAVLLGLGVRGSQVALNYAGHFPSRVQALICVGGTPRWAAGPEWPYGISRGAWDAAFSMLGDPPEMPASPSDPELAAAMRDDWEACGSEAALDMLARTRDEDMRHWLHKVIAPTLVIHLAHDALVSFEAARWLAEGLPNGFLEVFDAERSVPLRAPHEVAEHIGEFLKTAAG